MQEFYAIIFDSFGYWHWFGIAIGLILLDLVIGTHFFLVLLGGCAALVGICALILPSLTWQIQLLIFSILSVLSLLYWWYRIKGHVSTSDKPFLNQRASQYIGRTFTLDEPIINGRGRIHVDDSMWRIEGQDLDIGAKVVVVSADGVVLKVEAKVD